MQIRTAKVTLTGITPLLMHRNDPDWQTMVKRWIKDPANREKSIAGDDRTPAWTWLGGMYHDGIAVGIPSDCLMTMLREGGAKVPTGKRGGSFKRQTQSGLIVMEPLWEIRTADGKGVAWKDLKPLMKDEDFEHHREVVGALGFSLFMKPARIGKARHIRVRGHFAKGWTASGTIAVTDDAITSEVFENVLTFAGKYAGLCDWRPSSPSSPGAFGQFVPTIEWVD